MLKIISISGIDGSGKSTQIQTLKNYLKTQGKRVFYFHAVQFGIANKIKSGGGKKSVTRASWFQVQLRKIALKIDLIRFKKLRNKLRNSRYDYILSDRYFYDTIVNIDYLSDLKNNFRKISGIIKPDLAIYLKVAPEIIMQRTRIPDQGLEYLKEKNKLYDKHAGIWNFKVIDGNQEKEIIFEEIKKWL